MFGATCNLAQKIQLRKLFGTGLFFLLFFEQMKMSFKCKINHHVGRVKPECRKKPHITNRWILSFLFPVDISLIKNITLPNDIHYSDSKQPKGKPETNVWILPNMSVTQSPWWWVIWTCIVSPEYARAVYRKYTAALFTILTPDSFHHSHDMLECH